MRGLTQICAQTREKKNNPTLHHTPQVTLDNISQMSVVLYLLPLTSVLGTERESRWIWALLRRSTLLPRSSTPTLGKDMACAWSGGWCLSTFFCSTKKYPVNGQVLICAMYSWASSSKGEVWMVPWRKSPFCHLNSSQEKCPLVQIFHWCWNPQTCFPRWFVGEKNNRTFTGFYLKFAFYLQVCQTERREGASGKQKIAEDKIWEVWRRLRRQDFLQWVWSSILVRISTLGSY